MLLRPAALLAVALFTLTQLGQAEVAFVTTAADGKLVRVSGKGVVTDAQAGLLNPRGIVYDAQANAYVANFATGVADGTIVKLPSSGAAPIVLASGLNGPTGLALDKDGVLYAAISADGRILKIASPNAPVTFATLPAGSSPQGIAFGPTGSLFVANKAGNTISEVTAAGVVSIFSDDVVAPAAVAFDSTGDIFVVAGGAAGAISRFNRQGRAIPVVSGFNDPRALAIDRADNFYVVNGSDSALKMVTPQRAIVN